ncbi:ensconsin isoform X2 [Takifugu flavidus]|uniref:ensconsin isoform X2 n=1 Tax=Takifugu flavidus TaxID=433684 RepID=UPI00254486C9|nr:ensconsin isoform X2 [Takifugu flavidus]
MPESKRREKRGGGGGCRRGKRSQRRGNSRSATPALFTITEEEEGQRRRGAYRSKKKASYYHYKSEDGRESSATHPSSAGSMQVYTPSTLNRTTASNSPSNNVAIKSDSLLFNRIDERLRLARERRGELEKQNAIKEAQWQAREERARQHYERQLEEKRKKLEEQRVKEDRRRAAVEEKRRQKLEEDKARHEAAIRRTVDRSQRAKQKPNRWSWGGSLQPGTPSTAAGFVESAFLYPLDLAGLEHMQSAFSLYRRYGMTSRYADRRSVSTTNLSKHADSVITKRLSVSSATLLHSPDRGLQMRTASSPVVNKAQSKPRLHQGKTPQHRNTGLRRLPLTPWETNVVTRLQQPTHSYLARSRSAMSLSGDHAAIPVCPRSVSCQPMGSVSFKALQAQPLPHCRSQDRSLSRETVSSSSKNVRRRTTGSAQPKDRNDVRKSWSNLSLPLTPLLTLPPNKYLSPPGKRQNRATAPSPGRPPQKPTGRPPTPKLVGSPGAEDPGNLRPVKITPESPQQTRSLKEEQDEEKHTLSPPLPRPQPVGQNKPINEPAAATERVISPPSHKPSAGTTDPEEASRILAENRRLVREQREREEEERRQQEEQARLAKEEMARRKAEERAKREEEALRQAEELRKLREEEERRQEEERWKREREEVARLQKQKEEEESRQKEEAERLKQERERHFQKQEAERMERKKRLEEIMKRTRRSEPAEKKAAPNRNGDSPAPTLHPSAVTVSSTSRHGDPDPNSSTVPSQPEQRLSPPEGEEQREQQGETVPVAFRENGLLKPLSGVEDISAQQGPDVA